MESKPVARRRGAAPKYDWNLLRERGWMFVPLESGHRDQGTSIRSSARGQGLRVSARRADGETSTGWLVEIRG